MNILHEIEACQRCIRLRIPDRLYTSEKPYVKFQVEQHWKPEDGNIKVLFIAESPPWSGKQSYFYNPNTLEKSSGLRKGVFKYLKIKSLEEFRGEGYFLIDAIKCRLNKKKSNTNVSKEVSKTCSEQFLEREIRELKTKTIFVLGNSAKKALQQFSDFRKLKGHKVTDEADFDEILSGHRVILCPFPSRRNLKYEGKLRRAFSKIA